MKQEPMNPTRENRTCYFKTNKENVERKTTQTPDRSRQKSLLLSLSMSMRYQQLKLFSGKKKKQNPKKKKKKKKKKRSTEYNWCKRMKKTETGYCSDE